MNRHAHHVREGHGNIADDRTLHRQKNLGNQRELHTNSASLVAQAVLKEKIDTSPQVSRMGELRNRISAATVRQLVNLPNPFPQPRQDLKGFAMNQIAGSAASAHHVSPSADDTSNLAVAPLPKPRPRSAVVYPGHPDWEKYQDALKSNVLANSSLSPPERKTLRNSSIEGFRNEADSKRESAEYGAQLWGARLERDSDPRLRNPGRQVSAAELEESSRKNHPAAWHAVDLAASRK